MNPLTWKREHRAALICAAALGALVGAIFGFFYLNPNRHFEWCVGFNYLTCGGPYLPLGYLLLLVLWVILGGLIGAAVVYIRQLLRT
jgi:hypothetical protein